MNHVLEQVNFLHPSYCCFYLKKIKKNYIFGTQHQLGIGGVVLNIWKEVLNIAKSKNMVQES